MPGSEHWIGPRIGRILLLLFGINAGTVVGDLLLGPLGGLIGAFAGFTIVIGVSRRRINSQLRHEEPETLSISTPRTQ